MFEALSKRSSQQCDKLLEILYIDFVNNELLRINSCTPKLVEIKINTLI